MSGFVYVWFDRKQKRYYIGSHWGLENDGYVCSSSWMKKAYKLRPEDFRRRIVARVHTSPQDLLLEEQRWLDMINECEVKPRNPKPRYYNIRLDSGLRWHTFKNTSHYKTIGEKISAAKKGKSVPCPEGRGAKISEAKRQRAAERRAEGLPARAKETIKRDTTKQRDSWKNEPIVACPHCGKEGFRRQIKVWHFDNCKQNPSYVPRPKHQMKEEHKQHKRNVAAWKRELKNSLEASYELTKKYQKSEETRAEMAAARKAYWDQRKIAA